MVCSDPIILGSGKNFRLKYIGVGRGSGVTKTIGVGLDPLCTPYWMQLKKSHASNTGRNIMHYFLGVCCDNPRKREYIRNQCSLNLPRIFVGVGG